MRVPIGNTDWAEISPVEQLTRADRKAVNATIVYEVNPESGLPLIKAALDDQMTGAILERVCTDWSLNFPPPCTDPASLDKLNLEQDDALRAAVLPHIQAIKGVNAPAKDNEVPTGASAS